MESSRCRVSIIVPYYNQKECLERLLPSIVQQTFREYEAVFLDDCSPDRSGVEYLKNFVRDHNNMRLIENVQNMGYVKTVNKGIKSANGEYVCLLNQDTEIRREFIERNVEIMDADASIGALSCTILDGDGRTWFSKGAFKQGFPIKLADDFKGLRSADYVSGCAPFYRKDAFEKVGLFDENYLMYHECLEFALRMRAETCYKVCVFSDQLVTHYQVPNIPKRELIYYLHRNHILVVRKYHGWYLPKVLIYNLAEIAKSLLVCMARPGSTSLLSTWSLAKGIMAGIITRQTRTLQTM